MCLCPSSLYVHGMAPLSNNKFKLELGLTGIYTISVIHALNVHCVNSLD